MKIQPVKNLNFSKLQERRSKGFCYIIAMRNMLLVANAKSYSLQKVVKEEEVQAEENVDDEGKLSLSAIVGVECLNSIRALGRIQ